jgi:DNA-binding response OmpR family regulator
MVTELGNVLTTNKPLRGALPPQVAPLSQKSKIILLEDDMDEAKITVQALRKDYDCEVFDSISKIREFLAQEEDGSRIRGFVIDLNLTDGDGCSVIPEIKAKFPSHPVLILSSRTTTSDKVAGFVMGVDDYVTKPCDPIELLYRLHARINKAFSKNNDNTSIRYKSLRLDLQNLHVYTGANEQGVELSANETKLLALLLRHPGQCFSRAEILERLWQGVFVSDRTIDSHISHLRKKITNSDVMIHSVYGAGYKLL